MNSKLSALLGALGGAAVGAAAAEVWHQAKPVVTRGFPAVNLMNETLPALCAHRGLSGLCAENTLPCGAAALAVGADELEFDVRLTKDGEMIVCHDPSIERMTGRPGLVSDYTLAELRGMPLNGGDPNGWHVFFATPEEMLDAFGGRTILNIHLYEAGPEGGAVRKLRGMILKRRLERSVYFAARGEALAYCHDLAPEIPRCALTPYPESGLDIVEEAQKHLCVRCQFFVDRFTGEDVARAKELGLVTNVYFADTPADAQRYLAMGIDVILSNRSDLILGTVQASRE